MDRSELITAYNQGVPIKYLYFWGHTNKTDRINASCLSQWYAASFRRNAVTYPTAEHFMMAAKAYYFQDKKTWAEILDSDTPRQVKALGRKIKGFTDEKWNQVRLDIVKLANMEKFRQNPELYDFLLSTKGRVLVEASPDDRVWGVGLRASDPNIKNPNKWLGDNLLGFALMDVREEFLFRGGRSNSK